MADSTIRGLNSGTATAPTADSYFAHQQTSTATRAEPTTFALMGGLEYDRVWRCRNLCR